jgi:hypothetical protein
MPLPDRFIIAALIMLLTGTWLFYNLKAEGVQYWSRQPDEYWFSAASILFSAFIGLAMLVWAIVHG